jgi:hypothetical protein
MQRAIAALCLSLLIPGCGGDDPDLSGVPAAAMELDTNLKSSLVRVMPLAANIQSSFVFILNPDSVLSQGVALTPDTSPGAPPHAFNISGDFDGNGDGYSETQLTGRAVFAADPTSINTSFSSVSGQMDIDISIPLIQIYHATVNYTVTAAQATVSGTGTLTNPLTGTATTLTVPANAPLVIKPATGAANAVANACGHSMDGAAQVTVAASTGTLRTTAEFSDSSTSVGLRATTFVDGAGQTSNLPNSSTNLHCGGGSAALADWVATYDVSWACLPRESGEERVTISVNGSSTLAIAEEGNPSGYAADLVGPSPHAVRGFYIDGPAGSRYREDFNWTLLKNGDFTQFSTYRFFEGSTTGNSGICAATARRAD